MVSHWTSVCLSVHNTFVQIFMLNDKLSKYQWIFTKLCVCIDIVEIWFELLLSKFGKFLTELSAHDVYIFFSGQ